MNLLNKQSELPISDDNVLTIRVPTTVKKVEILTKCDKTFVMEL
jgi:hypothetical protein